MKKICSVLGMFLLALSISLFGCEDATKLSCATISEITPAGSENYGVRVNYLSDSRLDGKSTDVQIKFNKIGEITIWQENQDKFNYKIEDIDEWYSMTTIFAEAKDKAGEEKFEEFKGAIAKTYLFNFDGSIEITFRVVVGDAEENGAGTGEILVGSEAISDNYTLKIK